MKLYDTYQGKLREFKPIDEKEVDIYYCGPTVYNYVHLGNFRPTVTFDLLTRFLKAEGYDVKCVSNYTDIDDKIIKQAKLENKTEKELSEFYIKAYEDCLDKLNILPLYNHPKASEYITKMADFIKDLEDNGTAYQGGDDIYFSVESDPKYGSLSKQKIDDLVSGARIDVNTNKKNPLDFALWKLTDDDGIKFDTSVGRGRPGWHTECVVMVNNVFKKTLIDIHGGGFDLKFPHHENEIAQSEAHNHTQLANYWMHCGFLLTNGVKMSKSLGNSILAKDVLERHSGNAIRLFFQTTHYRAPVNYTEENLNAMDKLAAKYENSLKRASVTLQLNNIPAGTRIASDYEEYMNALANDLNVANALSVIDREVKEINSLSAKKDGDMSRLADLVATISELYDILGLRFNLPVIGDEERKLLADFNLARENKDYAKSDELRPILMQKGLL
ncbi:MAG: cysteine--tRNA ligase [Bacilli bacterium]|nr:cysteine--tRNA ligase [Bacilli bacterium]